MSKIKVDRIENSSGNGITFPSAPLGDGYLQVSSSGVLSSVADKPTALTEYTLYDASVSDPISNSAYSVTLPQNIRDLMLKHPFKIVTTGICRWTAMSMLNDNNDNLLIQSQNAQMWTGHAAAVGYHTNYRNTTEIAGYINAYVTNTATDVQHGNCWISVSDFSIITYNDTTNAVANANEPKHNIATLLGRQWISTLYSPGARQDQYQPIHQGYMNQRFYHNDWTKLNFDLITTGDQNFSDRARIKLYIRGTE